ncbi:hypothetical protein AAFF_G00276300 [Aldrovandia affinis]|uniref:Uncharacterized protein n=1 Tax=Aldrovandia affinis TaxID=143900 RepID=A0AAD7W1X3_9TELE|nr:hypothetical protein AAFF_G00276300 [Aldrovandia affinis]
MRHGLNADGRTDKPIRTLGDGRLLERCLSTRGRPSSLIRSERSPPTSGKTRDLDGGVIEGRRRRCSGALRLTLGGLRRLSLLPAVDRGLGVPWGTVACTPSPRPHPASGAAVEVAGAARARDLLIQSERLPLRERRTMNHGIDDVSALQDK